jgi:hypothetical protein
MTVVDGNRTILWNEIIYSLLFHYLLHGLLKFDSTKFIWIFVVKLVNDNNWFGK